MKDSRKEQKTAERANVERRVKFAADQMAYERKMHRDKAEELLRAYRRGHESFAIAALIKKSLTLANASPGDIGISQEELDDLELHLIEDASQKIERLRLDPIPERLAVLRREMKEAGYSPELLGTTREELDGLQAKAQNKEARQEIPGHDPPFENRFR